MNPNDPHSVSRRRYTIFTPMLGELVEELTQWVRFGATGGIVMGRPRIGKTTASRVAKDLLQERFPNVATAAVNSYLTSRESPGAHFVDLLFDVGHVFAGRGGSGRKRERFMHHLCTAIEGRGGDRMLMFIDEAHKMTENEYSNLAEVQNWLEDRSLALTVFLIGHQRELSAMRTHLRRRDQEHLLSRFMCLEHRFRGVRTAEELESILLAYDSDSEYPRDSKICYTQHFVPELFAKGWRLHSFGKHIWSAFQQIIDDEGVGRRPDSIALQYVCRTIEAILIHLRDDPTEAEKLTLRKIMRFISLTGFNGSIRNLGEGDPEE